MKRLVFCLITFGFTVTAWGQSIGIGNYFCPINIGSGYENKTTFVGKTIQALSETNLNGKFFGGFVFFDINYLEASVGVYSESTRWGMRVNSPLIEPEEKVSLNYTALSFGLMGKYTFLRDSRKARFFLQLGGEYNLVLLAKLNGEKADNPLDWSHLWIKSGVGFDFLTRSPLFFRLENLFGFRLPSKAEKNIADNSKRRLENSFYNEYGTTQSFTSKTFLGFGITFRFAVGFRF
jgi:hypothetical protein